MDWKMVNVAAWNDPAACRALATIVEKALESVTEPIGSTKLATLIAPDWIENGHNKVIFSALGAMRRNTKSAHLWAPTKGTTFGHQNIHWLPQQPAPYGREDDGTPIVPTAPELAELERVRRKYEVEQLKDML